MDHIHNLALSIEYHREATDSIRVKVEIKTFGKILWLAWSDYVREPL